MPRPRVTEQTLRLHAPLLDAYLEFLESETTPFTIPGHKQRDLVGRVTAGDVPLHGGADTMKLSRGVLAQAEHLGARFWGADICRYSVGGSTHANQAMMLAIGQPGDTVIVPRTLHRSLLTGLVLAGLEPAWLRPGIDEETGLPLGITAEEVRRSLVLHPHAVAVVAVDPSYVGTIGDITGAARAAHDAKRPLIVDCAWAAHFGQHPLLPVHPMNAGADAVITSAHKTLPAISQGAILLARTERLDPARVNAGFEATHTTSPSAAILASIDAARALLALEGPHLVGDLIALVSEARARLEHVPGLRVLSGEGIDPTKLVLLLHGTGVDGIELERELIGLGLPLENADRDTIVAMVTIADDEQSVDALVTALILVIERLRDDPRPMSPAAAWTVDPDPAVSPREAFFARRVTLPLREAIGRVSCELIAPYPPGVPVIAPGERITDAVVEALLSARAAGVRIAYAADPTLARVQVIA